MQEWNVSVIYVYTHHHVFLILSVLFPVTHLSFKFSFVLLCVSCHCYYLPFHDVFHLCPIIPSSLIVCLLPSPVTHLFYTFIESVAAFVSFLFSLCVLTPVLDLSLPLTKSFLCMFAMLTNLLCTELPSVKLSFSGKNCTLNMLCIWVHI